MLKEKWQTKKNVIRAETHYNPSKLHYVPLYLLCFNRGFNGIISYKLVVGNVSNSSKNSV